METKVIGGDRQYVTAPEGRFTAKVARWNVPDSVGDILRPGVFTDALRRDLEKGRNLPIYFEHRHDDPKFNVGLVRPSDVVEDADGLTVSGQLFVHEETARQVFSQMERRTLNEWSIGFITSEAKPLGAGRGRDITKARLVEVSPVLAGACRETETLSLKAVAAEQEARQQIEVRRRQLAALQREPYRIRLDLLARRIQLEELMARSR